jgi:hypothetical protein
MVDQPPQRDRRPWPPQDRDHDGDDDEAPEKPPTEPEPPPIEEPSRPDKRGPYVVNPASTEHDQANEAAEGFATEVESLTSGVAPSEPGTFAKDPK